MLAALLPGLREVRTALVSGYLWLGTVILLVAAHSPSVLRPPYPVSPGLRRIGELMGQGGVLAAFSIASLLCGQAAIGLGGRAINVSTRKSCEGHADGRRDGLLRRVGC